MSARRMIAVPPDLASALAAHTMARTGFLAMSPSHQREYLAYILEAKKPETRKKRIRQAITMMAAYAQAKKKR